MNKKEITIFVILLAFLWGFLAWVSKMDPAPSKLTNEEIIMQTKICKDAGMEYKLLQNGFRETYRVECQ